MNEPVGRLDASSWVWCLSEACRNNYGTPRRISHTRFDVAKSFCVHSVVCLRHFAQRKDNSISRLACAKECVGAALQRVVKRRDALQICTAPPMSALSQNDSFLTHMEVVIRFSDRHPSFLQSKVGRWDARPSRHSIRSSNKKLSFVALSPDFNRTVAVQNPSHRRDCRADRARA